MSEATTAAFSDSISAHSTTVVDDFCDSEIDSSNVKVSDLLSKTIDGGFRRKSKIRRDMFGNLRAVPEKKVPRTANRFNRTHAQGTEAFTITRPQDDISSLLDPHIYVDDILERLSYSQDPRPVNRNRAKFSNRSLKSNWNPYLSRNDLSMYAQNYNLT